MNEYRLSVWAGTQRVNRLATLLRLANVRIESIEDDEVIVSQRATRPADAAAKVRGALLAEFGTHFNLKPAVLARVPEAPAAVP